MSDYTPEEIAKLDEIFRLIGEQYDLDWEDFDAAFRNSQSYLESAQWHWDEGRIEDGNACSEAAKDWEKRARELNPAFDRYCVDSRNRELKIILDHPELTDEELGFLLRDEFGAKPVAPGEIDWLAKLSVSDVRDKYERGDPRPAEMRAARAMAKIVAEAEARIQALRKELQAVLRGEY